MKRRYTVLVILFLLSGFVHAQKADSTAESAQKKSPDNVSLVITQASEVSLSGKKNQWFSSIIKDYYNFRFRSIDKICTIISADSLQKALGVKNDPGIIIPESDLFLAAKRLNATHVLIHTYDVDRWKKMITYYLEVVKVDDKSVIMTFDESFSFDIVNTKLNECTQQVLETIGIMPVGEMKEVLKRSILIPDYRKLRAVGELSIDAKRAEGKGLEKIAGKLLKIAHKDETFALAYYAAAQVTQQLGDHDQTARLYNHLIVRNGLYFPGLYVEAAKNFRLSHSLELAKRVLTLADNKGWVLPELLLENARLSEALRDSVQARSYYEQIYSLTPQQPDALLYLIRRYTSEGNHKKAFTLIDQLLKTNHYQGEAYFEKGKNLIAVKKSDEALEALRRAQEILKDNAEVNRLMGNIYYEKKDYSKAAPKYADAMKGMQTNLEVLLRASQSYKAADNSKAALDILQKYRTNFYETKEVIKEIGLLEFEFGDTAEAKTLLEQCVAIQPPDSSVFLILGAIYTASGDFVRAISMLERARPLVSDTLQVKMALADLYYLKKEFDKAEDDVASVLSVSAKYPRANRLFADIMFIKGKKQEALDSYLKERKYQGDEPHVQQRIAQLYFELENFPLAQKESEKLVAIDPKNALGYFQLAIIAVKQKRVTEAQQYLAQGEATGNADKNVYQELAKGFAAVGAVDKAIDAYEKCLEKDASNEEAWIEVSKLYRKSKRDTTAAQAYLKIFELNETKNKNYLADAGHIFYKIGMKKQAYECYDRFLKKGFSDDDVFIHTASMEYEAQRYHPAISLLQQISKSRTSDETIIKIAAFSYYHVKKYSDALPYLKLYIAKNQKDYEAIEMAAISYENTAEYKEAAAMYKQYLASENKDKNKEYAFHIGKLYEKADAVSAAIQQYTVNISSYPGDFRNHERLVALYIAAKNHTKATAVLEQATKEANVPGVMHKQLAELYVTQGKKSLAASAYENYLQKAPNDAQANYDLGALFIELKSYKQAIAPLEKASQLMPKNSMCFEQLAYAHTKAGNREQAIKAFEENVKLAPGNEKSWIELAALYKASKKPAEAARAHVTVYELNPSKNRQYLADAGHILYAADIKKDAYQIYTSFVQKGYIDHKVNVHLAAMEFDNKDYSKVAALLKNVSGSYASDKAVLLMLARAYMQMGNYGAAIPAIEKLLAKDPKEKDVVELAAQAYEKKGDIEAAITMYKRYCTLKKTDKHQQYSFHIGQLYEMQKAPWPAIKQYRANIALYPHDIRNYERIAALYVGLNHYSNAAKYLALGVKQPTATASMLKTLAEIYLKLKKKTHAISMYEKYLTHEPKDAAIWREVGFAYFGQKAYEKAIPALEKAAEIIKDDHQLLYNLGYAYFKTDQPIKAVFPFKAALQLKHDDTKLLHFLARCHETLKDTAALIDVLQKHVIIEPKSFEINHKLGMLLLQKGQDGAAIRVLEIASSLKKNHVPTHLTLITLYQKMENDLQCMNHITEVLKYDPKNAAIHYQKALFHIKKKQNSEAESSLKKTLSYAPKHHQAYYHLGILSKEKKHYKSAFRYLDRAVKLQSKDCEYLLALAEVAQILKYNTVALKVLDRAITLEPDNSVIMRRAVPLFIKSGKKARAKQILLSGIQIDSRCVFCHEQLGYIYYEEKDYVNAAASFEVALHNDHKNDSAMFLLAKIYTQNKQFKEALEYYEKAFALNPKNYEAFYRLIVAYLDRGDEKNAIKIFENNRQSVKSTWKQCAEGRILEVKKQYPAAAIAYNKVIRSMPNNADAHIGLGRIYLLQKKYDHAVVNFSKAMVKQPQNAEIMLGMGKAYFGQNNYTAALELFLEAEKLEPGLSDIFYMTGLAYSRLKQHEKAIEALQKGLHSNKDNSDYYYALGSQYHALRDYEKAIDYYLEAAKHDKSREEDMYRYVGDIYYKYLLDNKNAKKYYSKYLKAGGKSPEIEERIKKL